MEIGRDILNLLVDKFEHSKHFTDDSSVRRVILNTKEIVQYHTGNYSDKQAVHHAVEALKIKGFITYQWILHEEGNLLDKVILNLDAVDKVFEYLNRLPLRLLIQEAWKQLETFQSNIQWVQAYRQDMMSCLQEERRFHRLLPREPVKRDMLLATLKGLSEITELTERLFSTRYLHNSKAFEMHVRSRLITILKSYVVTELDDDQLLASVGLLRNYDELLLKGNLSIRVENQWMDLGQFLYGTSLNSDTIRQVEVIAVRGRNVLTIENKAVYYERIKSVSEDEIVIYLGGFFGKYTKLFLEKLSQSNGSIQYQHWGDIDLGGFMIFDTLKEIIGERLAPMYMDLDTLMGNLEQTMDFNDAYRERLSRYLDKHNGSEFVEVGRYMLEKRVRLEQEALIV